jgi:hypothetical protein
MAMGAIIPTTKQLRDQEWQNLRRQTLNKFIESKKTGAGGSTLTALDNIILDIVGRDSVKINALNIEDSPVVFGQMATQNETIVAELLLDVTINCDDKKEDGAIISGKPSQMISQESGYSLVPNLAGSWL